jgi:hypothetical protein
MQFSCLLRKGIFRRAGACCAANRQLDQPKCLAEPFGNNFLGPDELASPDETALHPHDNATIFLCKFSRFVADHAVISAIHPLPWLNFFDVEAMENFDQRVDGIFQIIAPL